MLKRGEKSFTRLQEKKKILEHWHNFFFEKVPLAKRHKNDTFSLTTAI